MKNYHSDNKFVLVREITGSSIKLAVDNNDFSYCTYNGFPIFMSRANLYLATKFQIKFPFIYVSDYLEYEGEQPIVKKFIS